MGTSIITISGGEPLMHPDLDEVIRHMAATRDDRRADYQWFFT